MKTQSINVEMPDETLQDRRQFISTNLGRVLLGAVATTLLARPSLAEDCHKNVSSGDPLRHTDCTTSHEDHSNHSDSTDTTHNDTCGGYSDSHSDHSDANPHTDHCNCS